MRVVHITPTYFTESSVIGGGERYVTELSQSMARRVDTTLVTFSSTRRSHTHGALKVEIFPVNHLIGGSKINPLSLRYLQSLLGADIVHLHHMHTLVSDLACLMASVLGKPVFVTDYGGGSSFALSNKFPVFKAYHQAIAYSQFGLDALPASLRPKATLVKGGIDTDRFRQDPEVSPERTILFVGRLLPHKGIDYLVKGFQALARGDYLLRIIGRIYDREYYEHLKRIAQGAAIEFAHDVTDERLVREYQSARVTVLPSVHRSYLGNYSPVPELMGFTLLESQACGTPVICTDAGAMHEFVQPGVTGLVVPQNSSQAIAEALGRVLSLPDEAYAAFRTACRDWITPLNWSAVVNRHLDLYADSLS